MAGKINKDEVSFVVIACCTYKRPESLRKSLISVSELIMPEDKSIRVELLVVDNDKKESARDIVESLRQKLPYNVHYEVEPVVGLSSVRNKVLLKSRELGCSHIALLDDDEVVSPNWLVEHIKFYSENENILISSGPTYVTFEKDYPAYIKNNNIFKSKSTKKHGQIRNICACGNVFFPLSIFTESGINFDSEYKYMGSEDGDFFKKASQAGYIIGWNSIAVNYEIINDERANLHWIFHRCFHTGYSGAVLKFREAGLVKRIVYTLIKFFTLIFNFVMVIFSIIAGPQVCFNCVGLTVKNLGKLCGAVVCRPYRYYAD